MDATPATLDRLSKRVAARWLWAVRLLWLAMTLVSLVIFARGVPIFVEALRWTYGANFGLSLQRSPANELVLIPTAGGQAARVGVMERDVLVAVDGKPVSEKDAAALDDLAAKGAAGTAVALQIRTGERPLREITLIRGDHAGAWLNRLNVPVAAVVAVAVGIELLVTLGFIAVAAFIFWRGGQTPIVWLSSLVLVLVFAGAGSLPVHNLYFAEPNWQYGMDIWYSLVVTALLLFLFLFPSGRFVPRWSFVLLPLTLLWAITAWFWPDLYFWRLDAQSYLLILVIFLLAGVAAQLWRYRTVSSPQQRQQTKWVVWGISVALTAVFIQFAAAQLLPYSPLLFDLLINPLTRLAQLIIPLTFALAVFQRRLWEIDLIVNRTLVYGGLTVLITAVYIFLVGGVSGLAMREQSNVVALGLATVVVLTMIRPLHQRLQEQVNRLLPPPPAATAAKPGSRTVRLLLLQTGWIVNALLAVILFGAGLSLQARHGFWQMPPADALTAVPLLASLPAGNNPLLHSNLYPFALISSYIQAAIFVCVGLFLFWRRSRELMGVLASTMLIAVGLGFTPTIVFLPLLAPTWHLPTTLFQAGLFGSVFLFLCLFPNGRFYPRWSRYAAAAWLVYTLLWLPFPQLNLHRATTVWPPLLFAAVVFLGIGFQVVRYRRLSASDEKQQTKWVIAGFVGANFGLFFVALLIALQPVPSAVFTGLAMLLLGMASIFIPLTIGFALLRYRLWEIDIIINRTLMYGGLTALITAVYILLVGGMGALAVNQSGQIVGFVLATMLVLVGIRPLRTRWQTAVNRLISPPAAPPAKPRMPQRQDEKTAVALRGTRLWLAWLALGLALLILAIFMAITAIWDEVGLDDWFFYLTCPAYLIVGTIIIVRRPANRIGRLCLLIGWLMLLVLPGFFEGGVLAPFRQLAPLFPYAFRFSLTLMQIVILLMFVYLPLLFPTGRYLNKNWRRFGTGLALVTAVPIVLTFIQPGIIFDWGRGEASTIINPLALAWAWLADIPQLTLVYLWGIPTMTAVLVAIIALIARWRSSEGQTKQQTKWVVFFLGTVTLPFITLELMLWVVAQWASGTGLETAFRSFLDTVYSPLAVTAWLGIPLVIGVAILKDRLYDIDIIINRTLVYGGLSLGIVAVYVLLVGALGMLFQSQGNFLFALLATGLIAVLFQPVRERLQRGVNRLMFGERDDPYAVLSKLGAQLQTTTTPEAMLQSVVETVATTLKLPYVAIELADEQGRLKGATVGTAFAETAEFPLRYQNETVGYLVVSPRSPGESFTERERQLLTDIAGQTGAMAYSVRLTAALQRTAGALQQSREKLVLAREEERRRIRRDLHDELGPTLASQTFALDAALDALKGDPQTTAQLLQTLKTQNQATVADIRRLVYELRPPALDELGLVGALQAHVAKLDGRSSPRIRITAQPDPLPSLSAAVEVAVYRIVLEAITNVVRHAQAQRCNVSLQVEGNGRKAIRIDVCDDGIGLPPDRQTGVGLTSMRERAEELGGSLAVNDEGDGVRITAVLPMSPHPGEKQI